MSIKSGFYWEYVDVSIDGGVTYPNRLKQLIIVYVSNERAPSDPIVMESGNLSANGPAIISALHLTGFSDLWLWGFRTGALPTDYEARVTKISNYALNAGVSIAPPFNFYGPVAFNQVYFNAFFDSDRQQPIMGPAHLQTYTADAFSRCVVDGSNVEFIIPVIWVKSDNTESWYGYIYAYCRGSSKTTRIGYEAGQRDDRLISRLGSVEPTTFDPYENGGVSGTGGGGGAFSVTEDDIDFPSLPAISAADTGFIRLFNPSLSQLRSLASYMWSSAFDVTTWQKILADPMDAILGLSIVPVAIPNGGNQLITVGNISTGIAMNIAASQYVELDCGSINVNEYWGAYLDYSPYTKYELYLPYIGTHAISADDITGKTIHIKYHVDILSGACCAYVKCGSSVLYSFIGQCSMSVPINGRDWTTALNGVLAATRAVGSMVASGGMSAPTAAATAAAAVNVVKPEIEKSGGMSGAGGIMGIQTPYLIMTLPRQAVPAQQNRFIGYPSFITRRLGDLSGYTEIESIHLEQIPATDSEITEIETLLKSGVIL